MVIGLNISLVRDKKRTLAKSGNVVPETIYQFAG